MHLQKKRKRNGLCLNMNGVINVYKEKDYTSHDVVAKLRGILRQKKIGHTGTLDPQAVGVLPVCLGNATKLCDYFADRQKVYRAGLLLGQTTDTEDIWGEVMTTQSVDVAEEDVMRVIQSFVGEYEQIPPMYSAKKVDGKKLYEIARSGQIIERKAASVEIYDITIEQIDLPHVIFTVHCSKGTYIRSLCRDIGEKLSCGGCMESLVRERVGDFLIDHALTLGQIEAVRDAGELDTIILPVDEALKRYKRLTVDAEGERRLKNGNPLMLTQVKTTITPLDGERFCIYGETLGFCGLYGYREEKKMLWPEKMFL